MNEVAQPGMTGMSARGKYVIVFVFFANEYWLRAL